MYVLRTLDLGPPVYISHIPAHNLTKFLDKALQINTLVRAQEIMIEYCSGYDVDYDVVSLDDAMNFEIIRSIIDA